LSSVKVSFPRGRTSHEVDVIGEKGNGIEGQAHAFTSETNSKEGRAKKSQGNRKTPRRKNHAPKQRKRQSKSNPPKEGETAQEDNKKKNE